MIKIVVLNDNRCDDNRFENEHGISLYLECFGKKILFDCGQTDVFIRNAKKLNINLDELDAIVLSHGDYDHGNGLKYINAKTKLICHPDFMKTRISRRTGNNNGLNQTKQQLKAKFDLIESRAPYYIDQNIVFLGQIERLNYFEQGQNNPAIDKAGKIFTFPDDSGLAVNTKKGLIVLSGCGHSGICNTVEYAKRITGQNKVLAVMGGFHLKEVDDCTFKTIEYMKDSNASGIYIAHCVSDLVCDEFIKHLPEKVKIIKTGMEFEFFTD